MGKFKYVNRRFRADTLATIRDANTIIEEYISLGFSLTLRQLYYQMVARTMIPNTKADYKRISATLTNARLAGLVDWNAIQDRTRSVRGNSHWHSPQEIIEAAYASYAIDKWQNQDYRVEVWIEKDALVGVIASVCEELDIDYFSCRGYTSMSSIWQAAMRLRNYTLGEQQVVVLHLADHDASGQDMTRDIQNRLDLLTLLPGSVIVERIALNLDQVEQYGLPPNPTKLTDSRAPVYVQQYGNDSWELDALKPQTIIDLVRNAVLDYRDNDLWKEKIEEENHHKDIIAGVWEH